MNFNEKIIQARKVKALTQEDLAEAVGVSRQAVSKWETGEAKPDLDKVVAIAKVLDLSMDYLCLDKQPEVTVELPQPPKQKQGRFFVAGIALGLVAAMLVGLVFVGRWKDTSADTGDQPSQSTAPTTTELTEPDYSYILSVVKVADARLVKVNNDYVKITFIPSVHVEGMRVQFAMRNNITGQIFYYDPVLNGGEYSLELPMWKNTCNFEFISVCSIGDVTMQFPLIQVESSDGRQLFLDYLWKQE